MQYTGKAAHNMMALFATSLCVYRDAESIVHGHTQARERLLDRLTDGELQSMPPTEASIGELRQQFEVLQALQDAVPHEGDAPYFAQLESMALPLQADFMNAADTFGWPQPGVSSTEDARPWDMVTSELDCQQNPDTL